MEVNRAMIILDDYELARHYSNALNNMTDYSGFWDEYYTRYMYLIEIVDFAENKPITEIIWKT